jgi:hypothetical protein
MKNEEINSEDNPKLFFAGALLGSIGGIIGATYFSLNSTEAFVVVVTAALVVGMLAWMWGGEIWDVIIDFIGDI